MTFGYFAWHLGALAYAWVVDKQRGFFWGPRSMVPQPRDLLDLWAMTKYFLYIGPRPKFDRFTYWEKFDYMGVFWGVAVIGISGLVLWLPTLATTFLPGWALNAAYVIHSDEALLATGFIFLFHFFHTHLRPEAFPMDTVVFTGRMPLEAFKEERPLEYERLVAQGKLEELMAPAPTAAERLRAYVFGFTTLTDRHRAGGVHLLGAAGRLAALIPSRNQSHTRGRLETASLQPSLSALRAHIGASKGAGAQPAALRCWPSLREGSLRCSVSRPRRVTRYAHCVRCTRTDATSQLTKRAARAAASPALLGGAKARCRLPARAFADAPGRSMRACCPAAMR